MRRPSRAVLSVVFLLQPVLSGCNFSIDKQPNGAGIKPSQELINKVSFQDVHAIFRMHCTGCHGSSGGVNLETHAGAKAAMGRIHTTTILDRRMPKAPYPALSLDQLNVIAAWIEAGGPELPLNGAPVTPEDPLLPKFESIKTLILQAKCVVCHAPGKKAENIPLIERSDLLDSPYDLVIPGDADGSGLILVLLEGARKKMPPSDSGISPVSENEIAIIKDWIKNGASD